jgi:hypothetical protein
VTTTLGFFSTEDAAVAAVEAEAVVRAGLRRAARTPNEIVHDKLRRMRGRRGVGGRRRD